MTRLRVARRPEVVLILVALCPLLLGLLSAWWQAWLGRAAFGGQLGAGRSLSEKAAPNATCATSSSGLPVSGVIYAPHLVGEPYPKPESSPEGLYSKIYSDVHRRDLPLIGRYLGADTVLLRPWSLSDKQPKELFRIMSEAGVCKMIPTFHVAKYYADLVRTRGVQPDTDSSSALFKDFVRFGSTLASDGLRGVEVVAWTTDLSLDLDTLLLQPFDSQCSVEPDRDPNYSRYKTLLEVLVKWVRQNGNGGSLAPALESVPLLVPLDMSRVSYAQPDVAKKLTDFLKCMVTWSPTVFANTGQNSSTRWLVAFALPFTEEDQYNFGGWLEILSSTLASTGMRAVTVLASQALRADPNNVNDIVQDYGNQTEPPEQQDILQRAFDAYQRVGEAGARNLDGLVLDEWQDDWDRGSRGPFYLARDTLAEMQEECVFGGRFSHDIQRCARKVGDGYVYPEFFGLARSESQALRHCVAPRFHIGTSFRFPGSDRHLDSDLLGHEIPTKCELVKPSFFWVFASLALLSVIGSFHLCSILCRSCCLEAEGKAAATPPAGPARRERTVGHVTVMPSEPKLRGGHVIEFASTRLRSDEETGWWLWTHVTAQMTILEKQVTAEVCARRALRYRRRFRGETQDTDEQSSDSEAADGLGIEDTEDDLAAAVATLHRRVFEGFAAWCSYVARSHLGRLPHGMDRGTLRELARGVQENEYRAPARLFAEALLLRSMESLGEQILQCPERLSYLMYSILGDAGSLEENTPAVFAVDFEELQSGLEEMQLHPDPYTRKLMPSGSFERGLNFDDINESGIQCRERVAKTYKEPASIMVVVDFFLCYRAPFMIKVWALLIATYFYLGSGFGNDITTAHNGPLYKPKWLRLNFIQYSAVGDACLWVVIEAVLILYVGWQRWPSLCRRSPGIPDFEWLVEHTANVAGSAIGAYLVYTSSDFRRKPPQCRGMDTGVCVDPRSETYEAMAKTLWCAGIYWACRAVAFMLMHRRHTPVFIHGTPGSSTRKEAGRTCFSRLKNEAVVNLVWFCMLVSCIMVEVYILLPAMRGLNWTTACGFNALGPMLGLPEQAGTCSPQDSWMDFSCINCIASVSLAGVLVFLGSMVDIYFVFYVFASLLGSIMGHYRHLNDLKNTSVPVDLRPQKGREAKLFEATFGPGWQQVWRAMARNLLDDSYISPQEHTRLVEAAGMAEDGQELATHRDKKMRPINLARFPGLAAERLAFFFHSLEWIETPSGPARGTHFQPETDALTGVHFDPGTVPSLTQIIPAYSEVVIPSSDFLRAGSLPEDAMNQSPEGQPGVGDMTDPPRGSGVSTNLAFMISQFPDEWSFLAKRLHSEGQLGDPSAHSLYKNFIKNRLQEELVVEVRLWAALRCQSIAKTVMGALQYERALRTLPKIKEYYARFPEKRVPEDHAEVILAHQTYGQNPPEGLPENDEAVRLLLMKYSSESVVLVFDLTPNSNEAIWRLVETFLRRRGGYEAGTFEFAGVKCKWDSSIRDLRVLEVLPRKFPLRLGKGDFKTQGKACNQLNGLRFASGHFVQALDCNMGVFMGEGFKVPYVLRVFMPLDQSNRVAARCRYLGFREYIYTGREGTVGKCHASAEWTFGTIYQRFLSGMGTRMHYGHPDFVDGFWARNRGGMSKSSPVVNLSEDIFAGYNVRMREEASPHIDALEFEKGREATFNAASNFFSKISGGSVAVIRSRDNHLLCERIGIMHSLSFYFTSVAFYVSNLIVDISTYVYVLLFIFFTLANIDLGKLSRLGSSFGTEWIISMGIVSLVPQLFEMILEFGAVHAIKEVVGGFFAATWFFIFQNKNIASAMRNGAATGIAKYFFTGRPMANQHQTWKDIYITYSKSHYQPAFMLLTFYAIYNILVLESFQGKLPMVLIAISFSAWFITPIIFSPFPRWTLIEQDLKDFNSFINGRAGMELEDLGDVIDRGQKGRVRTLFECGLADDIAVWSDQPVFVLAFYILVRLAASLLMVLALPAELMDFLWIYLTILSLQWVLVLGFFTFDLSNILLILSFLVWPSAPFVGRFVIGHRACSPSILERMPEYVISLVVFLYMLGLAKQCILFCNRCLYTVRRRCCPGREKDAKRRLQQSVRISYVYFFVHQLHCVQAYVVLMANLLVSVLLAAVDLLPCQPHTWWLLNTELARATRKEQYLEKQPTFLELEDQRASQSSASEASSSEGGSDASSDDGCSVSHTLLATGRV